MDIPKIIPVDFKGKKKVSLPEISFTGPRIKKSREAIPSPAYFDFLLKQRTLEGIIKILEGTDSSFNINNHRYSGLSKNQWCDVLEKEVRRAKLFSDN